MDEVKRSLRPVRRLYGHTLATSFGPLARKAVCQAMVDAGWCRSVVSKRVRRAFKWAASEELIPVATFQGLATVAGPRRGRTDARKTEKVDDRHVEATLPFLTPTVHSMVTLQWLTGTRPSEVRA